MTIAVEDRATPAHVFSQVEHRVANAPKPTVDDIQRQVNALFDLLKWQQPQHIHGGTNPAGGAWPVHIPDSTSVGLDMDAINSVFHPNRSGIQLGKNVRRWAPRTTEARSVSTVVKTHLHRLADALGLASVPAVTKVIQAVYQDSYSGGDDAADTSAEAAPRLASLMDEASTWAGNILDAMANADSGSVALDPDAEAASVAQDAAVAGDAAATLDTADGNGSKVRWVLDSANACQICQDAADGGPYDPSADDLPNCPAHKQCECNYEEVGTNDENA